MKSQYIKQKDSDINLPKDDTPYFIPSLNRVYVGQWKSGKPHGIGKIYYIDLKNQEMLK